MRTQSNEKWEKGSSRGLRERRRLETRAAIYAAAAELFGERGFKATTVDEITERAGVARRTFFLHFPTKDAVLFEYGARANAELSTFLDRAEGSAEQLLRGAFQLLIQRTQETPRFVRLIAQEIARNPTQLSDVTERGRTLAESFAGVIARGQASGELRSDIDPAIAGLQLASSFFSVSGAWVATKLDLNAAMEQVLTTVLDGMRAE